MAFISSSKSTSGFFMPSRFAFSSRHSFISCTAERYCELVGPQTEQMLVRFARMQSSTCSIATSCSVGGVGEDMAMVEDQDEQYDWRKAEFLRLASTALLRFE